VDARGAQLASVTVETTAQGYGRLLAFVADHAPGPRLVWAVESTRSHGVGLTWFLHQAGHHVIEAGRPNARSGVLAARVTPATRYSLLVTHWPAPITQFPAPTAAGKHSDCCCSRARARPAPAPPR
jgi:hypothetical protein